MSPSAKAVPSECKFLLDENIDIRVKKYLAKRGFLVLICPKGIKDEELINLARRESCILLTNDKDFVNPNLFEFSDLPGIVVFRIHPPKLGNISAALDKLLSEIDLTELAGKLAVLGEDGLEIIQ